MAEPDGASTDAPVREAEPGADEGSTLQAAERAFVQLRAEVDGVLLPEQVAEVRGKLRISQREAGRLLGGGPRAFQKYESGKVPVSDHSRRHQPR